MQQHVLSATWRVFSKENQQVRENMGHCSGQLHHECIKGKGHLCWSDWNKIKLRCAMPHFNLIKALKTSFMFKAWHLVACTKVRPRQSSLPVQCVYIVLSVRSLKS